MEELEPLVAKAQAGDLQAYGEVVRRFQDMAWGYAYSLLGDFHLAEDAAQEAFIEAYRGLPGLRKPAAFPGWFRRIVFKHCDRLTRGKRPASVSLEAAGPMAAREPGPSEIAEGQDMKNKILGAIRDLPKEERTVTTLFYVNGYSQRDVAEFLKVPVNTVKSRLHASRRRLKERMTRMVAQELERAKPGRSFSDRVRHFILLRRQGLDDDAMRLQESLLGILKSMARQGRHSDVVRQHRAAMEAIKAEGSDPRTWCQTYGLLADSYIEADQVQELVREIQAAIPPHPTPQEVALWVGEAVRDLVDALDRSGDREGALAQGRRLVELLRGVVGELVLEPWDGPPVGEEAAPAVKLGEILRTGRMEEYFARAEELLGAGQIGEFRQHVLTVLLQPEVVLMGIPSSIEIYEVPSANQRMFRASHGFRIQKRYDKCLEAAGESLALTERLRGHPDYRFFRMHSLLDQLGVAVERGDQVGTDRLHKEVYAELTAADGDLTTACPGLRIGESPADEDQRYWRERVGATYMIASSWLHMFKVIDAAEALRLARREADVHATWLTEERLARWTLAAEGDRDAALSHLRKAFAPNADREFLRTAFAELSEYAPVRDDPEFLAVTNSAAS